MRPLTEHQERFCRLFALPGEDGGGPMNAADAYRRAYPRTRTPWSSASKLLRDERVLRRLAELRKQADAVRLEELEGSGIASRVQRLLRKNRDWQRLRDLVEARARQISDVPGHETGLLTAVPRQIGGERVEVYQLDKEVLDALIALEESVAKEVGRAGPGHGSVAQVIILPSNGRDVAPDLDGRKLVVDVLSDRKEAAL